jgi:uncharacterized protein YlxP (DUF503 family)
MFVGVCRLVLHLKDNDSLKGKRKVLRSILDRTRSKFNAAVAEVQDNDDKKRAVIGVAVIGNEASHVDSMLSRISSFVEWTGLAPVSDCETEIISLGSELGIGKQVEDMWTPDTDDDIEDWIREDEH